MRPDNQSLEDLTDVIIESSRLMLSDTITAGINKLDNMVVFNFDTIQDVIDRTNDTISNYQNTIELTVYSMLSASNNAMTYINRLIDTNIKDTLQLSAILFDNIRDLILDKINTINDIFETGNILLHIFASDGLSAVNNIFLSWITLITSFITKLLLHSHNRFSLYYDLIKNFILWTAYKLNNCISNLKYYIIDTIANTTLNIKKNIDATNKYIYNSLLSITSVLTSLDQFYNPA